MLKRLLRVLVGRLAVALLPVLFALHAHGNDLQRGADTPRCKDAITGMVRETDTSVDRTSPSGDNVFLSHPAARSIVLGCSAHMPLTISAGWGGAYPPNLYFNFLAMTGAVITGESGPKLLQAIRKCQLLALKDKDEQAEMHLKNMEIDCQSFTRDGGGTSITIAAKHEDGTWK